MPKSKRSKVVTLTKARSQGRTGKSKNIDSLQETCDKFKTIYLFSCANLRTKLLKEVRNELKEDSRFFMGKNSVARLALGKTKDEAYMPGAEKLSNKLYGDVGLIFTNRIPEKFEKYFEDYAELDFARAGTIASKTVTIRQGEIPDLPSSMFEPLRKLHLPVLLKKGKLQFEADYDICKKGDVLTPEQAQALKIFGHKLARFAITLLYRWRGGELTQLVADEELNQTSDNEGNMEEEDDGY